MDSCARGRRVLDAQRSRPARPASSSTGTRPAADTKFESSKTGTMLWQAFTYEMPFVSPWMKTSQSTSSLLRRAFSFYATLTQLDAGGGISMRLSSCSGQSFRRWRVELEGPVVAQQCP